MRMNTENTRVVDEVLAAIAELEAGTMSVADLQATLQSAVSRFENDGSGITDAVRVAEADLEAIRFTMLLAEQFPAAILRLDELRSDVDRDAHRLPASTHCCRPAAAIVSLLI